MSGDLEPLDPGPDEGQLAEFWGFPDEVRQAALEYARGLALGRAAPEPLPDGEDVKFILVGVEQGGRAILFSSTSVIEAKFARQMDGFDRVEIRPGGPVARVPRLTAIVGAKMSSFEQHVGHDYREALATLLEDWKRKRDAAERESRRQLAQGGGGWL